MKQVEYRSRVARLRKRMYTTLRHLEVWINEGQYPHPFVAAALNLPTSIEDAKALARELSYRLHPLPGDPKERYSIKVVERRRRRAETRRQLEEATRKDVTERVDDVLEAYRDVNPGGPQPSRRSIRKTLREGRLGA